MTYKIYALSSFPNSLCSLDRLQAEIEASAIVVSLDYSLGMTMDASSVIVNFKTDLSGGEIAILDAIVAAHTGEPLSQPQIVTVENSSDLKIPTKDMPFDGPLYQTFCRFKTGKGSADASWKNGGDAHWSIDVATSGLTKVRFSPNYSFQIDGAGFRLRGALPSNELVFSKVVLAPGIPEAYGGSYVFIRNFEVTKADDEYERITAPKFIAYNADSPSANAIEFEITHDPADFTPLMVFLSIYKVPTV